MTTSSLSRRSWQWGPREPLWLAQVAGRRLPDRTNGGSFTEFSVQFSPETHPSHRHFRSEKGTKMSVGNGQPSAT